MTETQTRIALTDAQFAHLGEGELAYFRKVSTDEFKGQFPGVVGIEPGTELWALFAANGQPILLADERDRVLAGAMMNELTPVSIN